eukprot:1294795-Amphidinium_carterae.1
MECMRWDKASDTTKKSRQEGACADCVQVGSSEATNRPLTWPMNPVSRNTSGLMFQSPPTM